MGTPAGINSLPLPAPNERRARQSHARLRRRLAGLLSVLVGSLCLLYSSLAWYALDGLSASLRRDLLGAGALGAVLLLALAVAALRWFVAATQDATEQRLAELRSSANAVLLGAEAKSRFLGQFLADMSQDIRAPMHGVLGMTQLMLSSRLDPTQERQMRTIDGAARTLLRMVSDILDLSKLEANRYELMPMGCSLHDILRVSVDLLEPGAKDKGLALELRIENEVPDQVQLDAGRLQQVLVNLAQNAIDRTQEGSVKIFVRASKLQARSFELCVRIEDTGAPVSVRTRAALFDGLPRVAQSAGLDASGAAGIEPPLGALGLVVSKRLVGLMGGEIRLIDRQGAGAVFELIVPVPRIANSTQPGGDSSKAAPSEIRLPSPTSPLLVVEADGLGQMVAVELLENLGFEVEVASSAREAIEHVERKRYALVLIDCQLPERGGYLAAQRIRALYGTQNRTPIIGCSRSGSAEERSRALDAGLDDHLYKPLERSALCNVLARWLPDEGNPTSSGTRPTRTAILQRATAKGRARMASPDSSTPAPSGGSMLAPGGGSMLAPGGGSMLAPGGSTSAPDAGTPAELLSRERSERLLEPFVLEAPEQIAALSRALERADDKELVERARQLEQSCLRCGVMKLAELCRVLGTDPDRSRERLEAHVQALHAALPGALASLGGPRTRPENATAPASTDANRESP